MHVFHTYLSPSYVSFLPFANSSDSVFIFLLWLLGRSWHVGLSGPLILRWYPKSLMMDHRFSLLNDPFIRGKPTQWSNMVKQHQIGLNQIRSQSWLVKYDILATHSRRPRTSSICTSRPCWIRLARNYWGAPPCELPSCLMGTQPLSAHRGGGNPGCHKPPIVDEFSVFALTTVNLETINVYAATWMECAISGKA